MIVTYKADSSHPAAKNFLVREFGCTGTGCCREIKIDEDLVNILQKIRDHFGRPVKITSGYRCPTRNKAVGGTSGSYHMKGMASDIVISGVKPAEVARYAESIGVLGIGLYEGSDGNFVHVDTRTSKSFWYGHKQAYRSTFAADDTCTVKLRVLRRGMTGEDVKAMQRLLIAAGYGGYKATGSFYNQTLAALKEYQADHGLEADGQCGPATWGKLLGEG